MSRTRHWRLCWAAHQQVVNVRGADRRDPILIYIMVVRVRVNAFWMGIPAFHGSYHHAMGPAAGSVISWTNYKTLAPTLTIDRYRDDTIELDRLLSRKTGSEGYYVLVIARVQWFVFRHQATDAYTGIASTSDPQAGEHTIAWTLKPHDDDPQAVKN